jgi:hypothetical protein
MYGGSAILLKYIHYTNMYGDPSILLKLNYYQTLRRLRLGYVQRWSLGVG